MKARKREKETERNDRGERRWEIERVGWGGGGAREKEGERGRGMKG